MRKLLAQVPYSNNQTYDFYEDSFADGDIKVAYEEILGYGYSLTHSSTSINLIPVGNSTTYNLIFYLSGEDIEINNTGSNVMLFKNKKQKTFDVIFYELVKCVDAVIAPIVFRNALTEYVEQGSMRIGDMTFQDDTLYKKTIFGTKQMHISNYGFTKLESGHVKVYNSDNKLFYDCRLIKYNAPIMGVLLDSFYGWYQNGEE